MKTKICNFLLDVDTQEECRREVYGYNLCKWHLKDLIEAEQKVLEYKAKRGNWGTREARWSRNSYKVV